MANEVVNTAGQIAESQQSAPKPEEALGELKSRLAQLEDNLKAESRAKAKREQELERLQKQLEDQRADRTLSEAMMALLAKQAGRPVDEFSTEVKANAPDLAKEFQTLREEERKRRQQEEFSNKVYEYQQKVTDAGLTENDEDYWAVYDVATKGQFKRADLLLDKIVKNKATKVEPPKVIEKTEAERQKEIEEAARRLLEERGQLKTETGGPSAPKGKVYTQVEIEKMPVSEYKKLFPNYVDFLNAMKEGRIK